MHNPELSQPVPRRLLLKSTAAAAGVAAFGGTAAWSVVNAPPAAAAPGGNFYAQQAAFVEHRFGMFMHFNMATFSDEEWATGGLDPKKFNPTQLDCAQWAAAAKSAGMTISVLTTKHHDGFCLWPTKTTAHNVMNSSVPKDVIRLYVDAFRDQDISPCFYFSVWDRTQGVATGSISRADIDYTKAQLTELLSDYGEIQAIVIDGWAWQMGHQQMPYDEIRAHIKGLQPNIVIIDLNGVNEPWQTDAIFFEEPKGIWAPPTNTFASCQSVNIVNTGWFWHPPGSTRGSTADSPTRTVSNIVNDHIKVLEKRYCSFLLNCMPNNKGLFDANILATLKAVGTRWQPDTTRPPLPAQPDVLLYPVTPVAATATSGVAANAIDGKVDWAQFARESRWQSGTPLPQSVTMDLGAVWSNIDAVTYLPRQDRANVRDTPITTGNITGYRVLTSTNGTSFTEAARGAWAGTSALKYARFAAVSARYVRLEATATVGGGAAIVNELDCGGIAARPARGPVPPVSVYKLVNRRSGLVIGVNAGSAASAATIVQQRDTGSAFQRWQLVDAGSGYTKLVNRGSGLVLDVTGKSTADGAAVIQYRDTGGTNQHWLVVTGTDGYTKLTNRNSGKVLDVTGGSVAEGAAVTQWTDRGGANQQWQVVAG
ncbi:MAG TPA: RICIN domain-containing protein [Catenuloplanes sp.]